MIRFRYQPTFEDYAAFNRIVLTRQLRMRPIIGLAAVLLVVFLANPFLQRATGTLQGSIWAAYWNGIGLLFIPVVVAFLLIVLRVGTKRRWRDAVDLREAASYEIDEEGIRVSAVSFSSRIEWSNLKDAELKRGYFLLRTGQQAYYYFPASVVPDQAALISLLQSKGLMKGR